MTNTRALVSVVVPSYNHRQYISETIASIESQDYPNLEIIIIDDGSRDGSPELIESIVKASPRKSQFITKFRENRGAHNTINEGLALASGDYLTILNSDDFYAPNRIRHLKSFLDQEKAEFAFSLVELIDSNGVPFESDWYTNSLKMREQLPSLSYALLLANFAVTTGNFFFTRGLYEKVGEFQDYVTCHDWDFLLRCIVATEPVMLKKKLMSYRMHATNTISKRANLIEQETANLFFSYLSHVNRMTSEIPNPQAPCFRFWGPFWKQFVEQYFSNFTTDIRFKPILY